MRFSFLIFFYIILCETVSAQKKPNLNNSLEVWKVLRTLKYESKETGIYQPFFSTDIQNLDGKKITLEGFMVVIQHEKKPKYFMISYFPLNSCFFCGAAGPETVVEVLSEKPVSYTEDSITMTGTLKLNSKDESRLFYILEKASLVE